MMSPGRICPATSAAACADVGNHSVSIACVPRVFVTDSIATRARGPTPMTSAGPAAAIVPPISRCASISPSPSSSMSPKTTMRRPCDSSGSAPCSTWRANRIQTVHLVIHRGEIGLSLDTEHERITLEALRDAPAPIVVDVEDADRVLAHPVEQLSLGRCDVIHIEEMGEMDARHVGQDRNVGV